MTISKTIILTLFKIIGAIIYAVVLALGTLFLYFTTQTLLFARGDYLLFISSQLNMIPVTMILNLFVFASMKLKEKLFNNKNDLANEITEDQDDDEVVENDLFYTTLVKIFSKLEKLDSIFKSIYRAIRICYIPILVIAIYIGITSYTVVYDDTIKISSPLNPTGAVYNYDEIDSRSVGVSKIRGDYYPYYEIKVGNKTVDLFGNSVSEGGDMNMEEVLLNIDTYLKELGVPKAIDKSNFDKFAKGLNEGYIKKVEKLFNR
ncbi:hypothetical protein HYG86_04965 [Alkalicella caledoniensis]|uniref:Uncharacterized protein n=1 Tax=Alkalicella caledoniensis TaxID=2731377 RepID=A0A7G9W655_ALKCA|nr:hypothetical protein [Alkalicella caledoniensis]QNO14167.1 hypothetical protein HYG86_04965 [Alkalicella caledoniensis]